MVLDNQISIFRTSTNKNTFSLWFNTDPRTFEDVSVSTLTFSFNISFQSLGSFRVTLANSRLSDLIVDVMVVDTFKVGLTTWSRPTLITNFEHPKLGL